MSDYWMVMLRTLRPVALVLALWAGLQPPALALDSHFHITDYRHDVWGAKEGAPATIICMAQSADGWMWLGTYRGLYRFDGVSFERFVPPPGEALLYNAISTLTAAPNGDLLIGYLSGGLSILRNGHLLHLTSLQHQPFASVFVTLADADGSYWVGAVSGLWRLRGTTWEKIGAGWDFPGNRVDNMVLDQYGRLFVSDGKALYVLDRDRQKFRQVATTEGSPDLNFAPDGQLWLRSGQRLARIDVPHDGPARVRAADANRATNFLDSMFDRDGNLWLTACPERLCMVRRDALPMSLPATASFEPKALSTERLPDEGQRGERDVGGMLEDRDGNIWLTTMNGLERFRHNRLAKIAYPVAPYRVAIARNPDGAVMVTTGSPPMLYQIDDNRLRLATENSSARLLRSGIGNTLLLATQDGLVVQGPGRARTIAYPDPSARETPGRLLQESADSFWIGWAARGTFRYSGGQWTKPGPYAAAHQGGEAADGRGHVWMGYPNNRVVDFSAGAVREYGAADGVDVRVANFIDVQREVLIVGDGGLQVLLAGRFRHVRAADPEVLSGINGLLIAPNNDRWFNSANGVLHVTARDWQAAMADPTQLLHYDLLDQVDGYPGSAQTSTTATAVAAPDGRMWFAASGGIALYDPRHDHRSTTPPAPVIRAVTADGQRLGPSQAISLPAGTDRVTIEFTALSYTMPERTMFRYRLDGIDKAWQGPLSRRDITYAHLGPGHYTFTLQAAIASGVWSAQPATVGFTIHPRFTQTYWFMALCVLLFAALVLLGHRWRLRQVTQRLYVLHRERQRIARTLHDTFLQSLQALVWRFDAIKRSLPVDEAGQRMIANTLAQADEVMAEGRRQILDLRPDGVIEQALDTRLEGLVDSLKTRFAVPIHLTARHAVDASLTPQVASEAYHIAQEAMLNALRHGQLTVLEIDLAYTRAAFTLTVRDDGGGIDGAVLVAGGRAGHWGLTGMRERARAIGGNVAIDSVAGKGTVVTLTLARRVAYAGARGFWRF